MCVPEKNPSTSSSVSSKILNEIDLLQVRLSNVIAATGAVVVSRRRIGKITDNYHEPIGRGGFGQVYKETWHGRQVAVKEIRSPLALQHSRQGSFVRQDDSTRNPFSCPVPQYYWTARSLHG